MFDIPLERGINYLRVIDSKSKVTGIIIGQA